MTEALDALSWLALLGGSAFCIVGAIGLLRMPDFWARTHAAGLTDTLGAGLILTGLMFQGGMSLVTVKLLMILGFLYMASPTAGHALFRAAHSSGVGFGNATERNHSGGDEGDHGSA